MTELNLLSKDITSKYSELISDALDQNLPDSSIVSSSSIERCTVFLLNTLSAKFDSCISADTLSPQITIPEYLEITGLRYRNITLPANIDSSDYGPIIALCTKNESTEIIPCVLYKDSKKITLLYDSEIDKIIEHSKLHDYNIKRFSYQVFASLPPKPSGILDIAKFSLSSFSNDLLVILYASVALSAFNICIPILTAYLTSTIIPSTDLGLLYSTSFLITVIIISASIGQYFQGVVLLRLETQADTRLQTAVWSKLLTLSITFFEKYSPGDLSSRVNSITQIRKQLGSSLLSAAISVLFGFTYFIGMLTVDTTLSLVALGYSALVATFIIYSARRSANLQIPLLDSNAELNDFSLQTVIGFPQVRTSHSGIYILNQIFKRVKDNIVLQNSSNYFNDLLELGGSAFSPLATWLLLSVITYFITHPSDSSSQLDYYLIFISFNAYFAAFILSISTASNTLAVSLTKALALWKRVEPIIYATPEPGTSASAYRHELKGEFEFSNVSYAYPGSEKLVLTDNCFKIEKQKYTALTGPSGSGKSTIARLILGFDQPKSGNLLVDGNPLHTLSIRHFRSQLGVVMQNISVNPGTIYDVICAGSVFTRDEVWEALEKSSFADDVKNMPMGIETIISEGGSNLSGGQRQRLILSAALISKPKVLILDEATSALDEISQSAVTNTLESLSITRIAIAHRTSTIRNADKIIVLEDGKLTQSGTFDELINEPGYFKTVAK